MEFTNDYNRLDHSSMRWTRALLAIAFTLCIISCGGGQKSLEDLVRVELIHEGFIQPISAEFLPGGSLLLAEKAGRVWRSESVAENGLFEEYMQLADVDASGERGLIDLAAHPNYLENGFLYFYYCKASTGRFRVTQWQSGKSGVDLSSEKLIWENPRECNGQIHFGGSLAFGPDGMLYLSTGDEALDEQPQDLTLAGGKILRLDPQGGAAAGNPFEDGDGPILDEIWAYGLRNPFRATWDLITGRYFIAEVGGNNHLVASEDLHLGTRGANFGWPPCEGLCDDPILGNCDCDSYSSPIYAYAHAGEGAAIVGGCIYPGGPLPEALRGAYLFGDYVQGWIKYVQFDDSGTRVSKAGMLVSEAGLVVDIVSGPDGQIYFIDLLGKLSRIVANSKGESPELN